MREFLRRAAASIEQRDQHLQKRLIRTFVRKVEWDPRQRRVYVHWFDLPAISAPDKEKVEPSLDDSTIESTGDPNGIRTRVTTLKEWCPRPLDHGAS